MVDGPETRAATVRRRIRRWGPAVALLVAFVSVSVAVVPRIEAEGSARTAYYELESGQSVPGLRVRGLRRQVYGFEARDFSSGRVSFPFSAESPRPGERTDLLVSAGGGPAVSTQVTLIDTAGVRHELGRPTRWINHRVDVTSLLRGRGARLEITARNRSAMPALVADQVTVATYPPGAVPDAGRGEVALWVALALLAAVALLGRVRRDALLAVAGGLAAYLVWPSIVDDALEPPPTELWEPATDARWVDLERGLLSGTFDGLSSLAVQLFHALTPVTGTGLAGARTASMLVGVLALVAVYALGRRVAGLPGAVVAVACLLLADPFRLDMANGKPTTTLVLAACLFLLAVHRALVVADRRAMLLLGAGGALAILAEPTWWPGVLAAIVLLAVRHTPSGMARSALVTALLALVIVSLPSRVSVAHQSEGDLNGDVVARATLARNVEFVGRGHGAPGDREELEADPRGGSRVGLFDYVVGEHSPTVVAGGILDGAYKGLSAAAERPDSKLPGLIAFVIQLIGLVFLLVVPWLRPLVLVPAMLAAIPWFFAGRDVSEPLAAHAAFWPATLVGAAVVAYAVEQAVRPWLRMPRFAQVARQWVSSRANGVLRRARAPSP